VLVVGLLVGCLSCVNSEVAIYLVDGRRSGVYFYARWVDQMFVGHFGRGIGALLLPRCFFRGSLFTLAQEENKNKQNLFLQDRRKKIYDFFIWLMLLVLCKKNFNDSMC
jgi:hypothetical protein